jgi:ribosomal protein S18 acetylase RimI-like enzyme
MGRPRRRETDRELADFPVTDVPDAQRAPVRLRIDDFLRRADAGASTSTRRFAYGTAYFHDDLPHVWDRNYLLIESGSEPVDALALESFADQLQGGAGLQHRKVVFEDPAVGARLTPALVGRGWVEQRLSVMVHGGVPPALSTAGEAVEVDRKALEAAVEKLLRTEPYGNDEEIVRELLRADLAFADTIDQRCFAKLVDGEVVSICRLYSDGELAQIEDVATLLERRDRGHARAVVSKAVVEGLRAHGLTFILAVDGRWVKQWYERIGFEQIGLRYEATRSGR